MAFTSLGKLNLNAERAVRIPISAARQLGNVPHLQHLDWHAARGLKPTPGDSDSVLMTDDHPAFNLMTLAYLSQRTSGQEARTAFMDLLDPYDEQTPRRITHPDARLDRQALTPQEYAAVIKRRSDREDSLRFTFNAAYTTETAAAFLARAGDTAEWLRTRLHRRTQLTNVHLPGGLSVAYAPSQKTLFTGPQLYLPPLETAYVLAPQHEKPVRSRHAGPGNLLEASDALGFPVPARAHVQRRGPARQPKFLLIWMPEWTQALQTPLPTYQVDADGQRTIKRERPMRVPLPKEPPLPHLNVTASEHHAYMLERSGHRPSRRKR